MNYYGISKSSRRLNPSQLADFGYIRDLRKYRINCLMRFSSISIFFIGLLLLPNHIALAQYEDNIVVAQEWEGIYELLQRNDLGPEIHKKPFIELNRQKLGSDTLLTAGNVYFLPNPVTVSVAHIKTASKPTSYVFPVFGKKYENVPIIDHALEGAIFYLVSGHGGPDPGALGKYGGYTLSEDEYAYDVTLRLARNLISHSAKIYLIIQDKDDGIRDESILKMDKHEMTIANESLPFNQKARLKQRADEVNKLYNSNT